MRWALVLAGLAGCGHLDFVPVPDAAEPDADGARDAAIDVLTPDTAMLLETVTVPVDGSTATSATTLGAGLHYTLVASGTFTAVPPAVDPLADAEYYDLTDPSGGPKDIDTSSMIDFGLAIDETTVGDPKSVRWGAYRADHVYMVDYVGSGAPLTAKIFDCCYTDNTGSLSLEIYR